jgi:ribosomal protein L29
MSEMYNFKYHSVEDLEKLIENLKTEIGHLRNTVNMSNLDFGCKQDTLKESEDMLTHAEFELLERTLLQRGNEGGCSN